MTDIKIELTHRTARIDGADVGGEFIPLTVLIGAGGRGGTKDHDDGQAAAMTAAGLGYTDQNGRLRLGIGGLRFLRALIDSIPARRWERITYDWQGTRQTVILEDPSEDHAGITGALAGTDGQGGWLHTIPAGARIITRQPVTREYFTGQPAGPVADAIARTLDDPHPAMDVGAAGKCGRCGRYADEPPHPYRAPQMDPEDLAELPASERHRA